MGASADSAIRSGVAGSAGEPWSYLAGYTADRLLTADDPARALPEILEHITAAAAGTCALVIRPESGVPVAWHAGHSAEGHGADAPLGQIRSLAGGDRVRPGIAEAEAGGAAGRRGLLVATAGSRSPCALAVLGRADGWPPDARIALSASVAIIAGRLRQDEVRSGREELAAAVIATDPRPVVVVDDTGRLCEFNRAAEELYQMSRLEVLGCDALTLLVPEQHRSAFREAMSAYLSAGDTSVFGTRARLQGIRPDGTRPVTEFSVQPVHVADRTYFAAYVHEVSAAGQEGRDTTETDVRFGMLSELAPVGIVQADAEGTCTFVNGRWCRLTGQTVDQALGRSWLASVHPDEARQVEAHLADALAANQELRADLRLCSTGGGRDTWVHAAVRPMTGADGACTGQLAAFTNVDARKRAESERETVRRQLTEQNEKLRDLDLAKTRFLGTVSHELRSPLTSIVSFTELLGDDAAGMSAAARDYLEIIRRNAERLLRLVGDLLYLNRLDEGGVSLELARVCIPDVVGDAVTAGSASAAAAGVRLRVSAGQGPVTEADHSRLQQVLDNLISNAIKFSDRGGQVQVLAKCDRGEWRISVSDEGIGIPADELSHLFDRFFRASNAVAGQVPGTGLGLATAKAIAELHGGSIEAASRAGSGTTITVHLPVRP